MGGSPGIGVFTRVTTPGCAGATGARACAVFTRRPRCGPGALAGPDASSLPSSP